jgi:hypothetical protein
MFGKRPTKNTGPTSTELLEASAVRLRFLNAQGLIFLDQMEEEILKRKNQHHSADQTAREEISSWLED